MEVQDVSAPNEGTELRSVLVTPTTRLSSVVHAGCHEAGCNFAATIKCFRCKKLICPRHSFRLGNEPEKPRCTECHRQIISFLEDQNKTMCIVCPLAVLGAIVFWVIVYFGAFRQ